MGGRGKKRKRRGGADKSDEELEPSSAVAAAVDLDISKVKAEMEAVQNAANEIDETENAARMEAEKKNDPYLQQNLITSRKTYAGVTNSAASSLLAVV